MLMTVLEMGNKLVCCRWSWIESPEIINNKDSNSNKYGRDIDNYAYGYSNHNKISDNEYITTKMKYPQVSQNDAQAINNNSTDATRKYSQQKIFSITDFISSDPFNKIKLPMYNSNNNYIYQHMDSSCRDSWIIKSKEQLQHISEREPEDVDNDPSISAKNPTLFLKRSKENPHLYLSSRGHRPENKVVPREFRRWSSCSSVLLDDTTISQPSPALSLKTLALAIHLHLRDLQVSGDRYRCSREDAMYSIFDERLHPVVKRGLHCDLTKEPSHREIYRFLRGIFNMAQLTPECAIVTLVYLERLLSSAEMEIMPWSWRRQLLASVLLASKVWDDQAVWNADYCQILKDLCVEDVNELERTFLELIQFNINVPSSVYAHYYFDLLQLGRIHGLFNQSFTRRLLSWDRAVRLEALNCPSGPIDDYSTKWWTKPRPLSRFLSWDSINGSMMPPQFRRVIIS